MECECECHCGGIPARDAMNDRLYWIELNSGSLKGTRCAAWRTGRNPHYPWVADLSPWHESSELSHEGVADEGVRVIHEIIPEE